MIEKNLRFNIIGKVKAKQSLKFANVGQYIKKYTPKDVVDYANWVKYSFMKAYPDYLPSELIGFYVEININAYLKVPKGFSIKKKEKALKGIIRPDVKPDWDNISKNICDALKGLAYPDDKAIVTGCVNKYYAELDYVVVEIKGFKNEN